MTGPHVMRKETPVAHSPEERDALADAVEAARHYLWSFGERPRGDVRGARLAEPQDRARSSGRFAECRGCQ
jgi:hypothetical protein